VTLTLEQITNHISMRTAHVYTPLQVWRAVDGARFSRVKITPRSQEASDIIGHMYQR
jgi:hypothetical protein